MILLGILLIILLIILGCIFALFLGLSMCEYDEPSEWLFLIPVVLIILGIILSLI
jgi:hypothetical protein